MHYTHTHTRNSSFETTTSNSNFVFKNFSRASSHSTSPWPRGNCLPDRAEIFINFLPPWSRSIRRYTRRSYTPPPPIPQRPKLLPQPCDTFPPPLSSAYRLLISAGVSSKPVLPPTVHPFSLLLSLLHAITITISPTVYPTVKPRFDKSCSRLGGGKEGVYNSTESWRRNGRKIFAPRIRTPPIESPLPPPPRSKRPWNNTRGPRDPRERAMIVEKEG